MAHKEQMEFFKALRHAAPAFFIETRVLEFGSANINGSVRELFQKPKRYVGVDVLYAPGVDWVGYAHEFRAAPGHWDVVISSEMFEHDKRWDHSWRNMIEHVRPGGLVTFSCATTGRPEHGTSVCRPDENPLCYHEGDYYRNLTARDFETVCYMSSVFSEYAWQVDTDHKDLYFWGIRRGEEEA
jgi:hypothetical protein